MFVLWFTEKYRTLLVPLMFVSSDDPVVSLMYQGKFFIHGCSHWYMNWDIFLVVLSQLDTFVHVQRLRIMSLASVGITCKTRERGREKRDSKHFGQEIY